ncbi:MAG: Uma2 family endonuclease [Acidobacteria bacterium]|nr:Uma2 family endonuclease [Acidobacteriota bacterium]MYJ05984.1 Uma2 family endonuclease [Acidobacteriota bacterium]
MASTKPTRAASTASQDALQELLREALPPQGAWSEEEYLWLTDRLRRPIEFTDGSIEPMPLPTYAHQVLLLFLYRTFYAHFEETRRRGVVVTSGLRMRVRPGSFREPDILLLCDRFDPRRQDRYWLGADLVAEVVSPDDPPRDLVVKRDDYAEAGITEYWIIDPRVQTVTVLWLNGSEYAEHGEFGRGDTATSVLLDGVSVDVTTLFDEAAE